MLTHAQYIYGMNAAYAEFSAALTRKILVGQIISIPEQNRERLACILMDIINDHNESSGNLLDDVDYYKASTLLNLIIGTAYSYNFIS